MSEWPLFPIFTVMSYETALPVWVIVWQVRSVRSVREASLDGEDVTRIEFANGDVLDVSDSVEAVLRDLRMAFQPVSDFLTVKNEA